MSSAEARIRATIEQLFRELDLLLRERTLESLRTLLDGAAAPAPRPRVPVARAGGGTGADLRDRARARIRSSPGESVEQIARALDAPLAAVKGAIQSLLAAKEIQRLAGRYLPRDARRPPRAVASRKTGKSRKSSKKSRVKRRGRKAQRSTRSAQKSRKAAKPRKPVRAKRPKKRAVPRPPRKVVVPARKRRRPATKPAEVLPVPEPIETAQPQLAFAE